MRITAEQLIAKEACTQQVTIFKREWPKGVEITLESLERATKLGLSLNWFALKFLSPSVYKVYDNDIAPAVDIYNKTMASTYKTFLKATSLAYKDYNKAMASAQKVFDEAAVSAQEAYDKSVISAEVDYHKAIISAHKCYREVEVPVTDAYKKSIASVVYRLISGIEE